MKPQLKLPVSTTYSSTCCSSLLCRAPSFYVHQQHRATEWVGLLMTYRTYDPTVYECMTTCRAANILLYITVTFCTNIEMCSPTKPTHTLCIISNICLANHYAYCRRYWWKPFDNWTVANCCTASVTLRVTWQRESEPVDLFISSGWICSCHVYREVIHYFDFGLFPVTLIRACCRPFGSTFPYLCHNLHVLEVMSFQCLWF